MMNWDNIKFLFQIPLTWFKAISDKVFKAYGNNFIRVRDGQYGGMEIAVDEDAFSNAVLDITGGGSGGGTVKSVDSIAPDANGNVPLGAIRTINHNYPDADGNVEVATGVSSVNSITPDAGGNVNLGTILRGVDNVVAPVNFGILELNAIRTINNRISTDFAHSFNVSGIVTSVNGVAPNAEGNVTLGSSSVRNLISYNQTLYPDQYGDLYLPDFVKTVNEVAPDSNGNVSFTGLVKSVNGYEPDPDTGDVDLGELVYSVNDEYPDENGNVEIDIEQVVQDAIDGGTITGFVKTVDGISPTNGNVDFGLTGGQWMKTDAQGHLSTTSETPLTVDESDSGFIKATEGALEFIGETDMPFVNLTKSIQTITKQKNWAARQVFRDENASDQTTVIDGCGIYLSSPANVLPFINFTRGGSANEAMISKTTNGLAIEDASNLSLYTDPISSFIRLSSSNIQLHHSQSIIAEAPSVMLSADRNKAILSLSPDANATPLSIATVGYCQGTFVRTVNNVAPDANGNVDVSGGGDTSQCLKFSDWQNAQSQHSVAPYVYSNTAYNGTLPAGLTNLYSWTGALSYATIDDEMTALGYLKDADLAQLGYVKDEDLGDLAYLDAITVDGHQSDASGTISFNLAASKWVKTDAQGHLTTTDGQPVEVQSTDTGYLYANNGTVSWKDEQYVTIDTQQTVTAQKTWSADQTWNGNNKSYGESWHYANVVAFDRSFTASNSNNPYQYSYMSYDGVNTSWYGLYNPGQQHIYAGQIGVNWNDSSVLVAGDYGLTIYSPVRVNIDSLTNAATLQRSPDANAPDNAIATVGWAKNTLLGGAYDSHFDVVTNVVWNGTTLVFKKRTLTYQKGILKSVSGETNVTIDTPVAY